MRFPFEIHKGKNRISRDKIHNAARLSLLVRNVGRDYDRKERVNITCVNIARRVRLADTFVTADSRPWIVSAMR